MNRRVFRLALPAILVATFAGIVAPQVAIADPIGDKQAQASQLDAEINANATKLAALNEQINSAQNQLADANATIATADALVAAAQAKTKELRSEVAKRAAAVYAQSGSQDAVEALDAQNAQDITTRQKYSSLAAQRDNQIVVDLAKSKEQLAIRKSDAEKAREAAQTQSDAIQAQKDTLAAGQADLEKMQSQVTGELKTLVDQAAAEREARDAATAAAQLNIPVAQPTSNGGGGGGSNATPPPSSGNVQAVLAYAYAQLGKPYCYAGVGPDCYDCSGLTMMAWAQAGVSMSHGSYDQQASFPAVSMDDLQPGDLVFWPGHVGIYVGNSSVLHAPSTGDFVKITPIWPGSIGAARP